MTYICVVMRIEYSSFHVIYLPAVSSQNRFVHQFTGKDVRACYRYKHSFHFQGSIALLHRRFDVVIILEVYRPMNPIPRSLLRLNSFHFQSRSLRNNGKCRLKIDSVAEISYLFDIKKLCVLCSA